MAREHAVRVAVRWEDELEIPADALDPEGFRRWVQSGHFPDQGRIDYLDGTIEIDMSPEKLQSHGTLKGTLFRYIANVVDARDLGQVFVDGTRVVSRDGRLSCEPDVVFVSLEALRAGRVEYRSASLDQPEEYLEVVGAATLVVEVVSNSSVTKDTRRLPDLYAATGVSELWIADGRGDSVRFSIAHLEGHDYRPAASDGQGYAESCVLERHVRLRREPWHLPGTFRYHIDERR